jgi:ABC-type Fe3+/spermidine/putrescine transport system ATPase subunit
MVLAPEWSGRQAATLSLRSVAAAGLGPVSLEIGRGAHVCLLGSDGAGTRRLLRAVAGLLACTGQIVADGKDLDGVAPGRRGFALVAERGGIWPGRSMDACLRAAQRLAARNTMARGMATKADATRAALLESLGLPPDADPARLDRDGTLRARLATALAANPRLLLLERPDLSGGLTGVLRGLAARHGVTVLHATDSRDDAFALADQLVLMRAGLVLQAGSTAALYERPASLDIACLVGPANVLPGVLVAVANDVATVRLDCGPLIEAEPPLSFSKAERPLSFSKAEPPLSLSQAEPAASAPGAACRVLLRPERIVVSPLASADLGDSAIAAVLRDVAHLGDTIRLAAAIGADTVLDIARPAALGTRGLVEGQSVSVAWQSRHALTFPA